ncbi:activin receptor type-1-like [Dermatophagoides pteronyssinus]|uniref:receptor protein serine/threonine kinase n=1 Tax=Dermatophagoides pteronyssinus TaxID=6956 RepID=A0A6P6YEZ3_DERPT|nr:activin receptor type-1-like [Dermatophagoides pteronyssinus]
MYLIKCHFCEDDDCFDEQIALNREHFCISKVGKCFTSVDLHDEFTNYKRGCVQDDLSCLPRPQTDDKNRLHHISNDIDAYIKCCSQQYCNDDKFEIDNDSYNEFETNESLHFSTFIIIIMTILSIGFMAFLTFCYIRTRRRKKSISNGNDDLDLMEKMHLNNDNHRQQQTLNSQYRSPELKISLPGDSTLRAVEQSCSSGSGWGQSVLTQRTVAKQITLIQCVGKGRYGEVWKGLFHYEAVAVKKFLSRDEASFNREIEIYTLSNLNKHENILAFICADVTSENSCTRLWLVTAYHELGSLFDFLSQNFLTLTDMLSIMTSIASGLTYLHTENFGTQKKVAIAHRDIKSKNILMKTRSVCCIADFGLAVTKQKTGLLDVGRNNYRVGTKRYMAPEVLDDSFGKDDFAAYTRADIYSFSLVLWEILRRSDQPPLSNYEVPYQYQVPSDPSFDDMRKIVCVEQFRPEIPLHLEMNAEMPSLQSICKIIRESWLKNPSSRLNALRIKKSLINLMSTKMTNNVNDNNSENSINQ